MEFVQDAPVEIPANQTLVGSGGMSSQAHGHSSLAVSQGIMGSMDIDPRTSIGPSADHPPVDTEMNMEFMVPMHNSVINQDVQSVWNSPLAGRESFADKIKKTNEIEGLKLEYFPPSISDDGCCRIHITQEDLKISAQASSNMPAEVEAVYPALNHLPSRVTKLPVSYHWKPPHCSHCVIFGHSTIHCSIKPKPMGEGMRDPPPNIAPSSESDPATVGAPATHTVTKNGVLEEVNDGFTSVTRRKKKGPLNLQRKKQNPVRVKISSQHYAPVQSNGSQNLAISSGIQKSNTPGTSRDVNKPGVNKPPSAGLNASKKVSKGFNFARAVQGDLGSKSQQPAPVAMSSKTAAIHKPVDLVSSNRFSVLDIPNSIKFNKLIGVQDDLYPPDQVLEEGMDLETNKSNCSNKVMCQLNREHADGSRILPESILSPPKQVGESSRGKSYGISDKQKKDIADRLNDSGSIMVDIVDQWCPGQWDYFNDLCTLMGLDPDYCIEDVDSDTENGTSQFLSGLLNSGAPKPPRKLNWKASSYLIPDVVVRMHRYFELEVGLTFSMLVAWNTGSCSIFADWDMGLIKILLILVWSCLPRILNPIWVLFWLVRCATEVHVDSPLAGPISLIKLRVIRTNTWACSYLILVRPNRPSLRLLEVLGVNPLVLFRRQPSDVFVLTGSRGLGPIVGNIIKGPPHRSFKQVVCTRDAADIAKSHGVAPFCEVWTYLHAILSCSSVSMDAAHKETSSFNRRTEPPDPTVVSRFWQSDESDSENHPDMAVPNEDQNRHRQSAGKKGKINPSHQLDGMMESALRRYGLRSDDTNCNLVKRNTRIQKSKSSKQEGRKQATHPYRLDKENKPDAVNRPVDSNVQNCAWTGVHADDAMQQDHTNPGIDHLAIITNVCMQVPESGVATDKHPIEEDLTDASRMEDFGPVLVNMEYAVSWDTVGDPECDSLIWNRIIQASKKAGITLNDEEHKQGYESVITLLRNNENNSPCNFFEQYPTIMNQLAKWIEILLTPEHAVGMKRKSAPTQGQTMVATENMEAQLDIGTNHQKKRKKRLKSHKAMQQKLDGGKEAAEEAENTNATQAKQRRKKYKIWYSKNRKPEKNLSKRKFLFNSNIALPKVITQPLGLAGFQCGTSKVKETKVTQEGVPRRRKIIGEFYKEAMEKEDNLMESVTSIIATPGNSSSKLLNSIKNMKSCKLSKFSAKGMDLEKEKGEEKGKEKINQEGANTTTNVNMGYLPRKQQRHEQGNVTRKKTGLEQERNVEKHQGRTVIGTKKQNGIKPNFSVVETANRFCLLDEDGTEIMDTTETLEVGTNEGVIPEDLNAGWIKTQESNLDAKYNNQVTPMQRIEAKKYVLDKLVPLTTVLSTWSILHLEYFRCLCSLHNFGAGYLAVSGDSFLGVGRSVNPPPPNQNEDVEEVESETDGTAEFMTEDIPRSPSTNMDAISLEPINHNVVTQPDPVMEKADTNSQVF
ncbi:hypothetical protein L1987_42305 [Smallanthus sonchifolius]|uniref:Uncharacterized protein n=1 Tax=Smallanthus sonchifolius TaxID=185202 RepID=A0ACB9GX62_9ASTR|nr:hypothetical protein L1987_42305 [Smallanthus sonchifolius]